MLVRTNSSRTSSCLDKGKLEFPWITLFAMGGEGGQAPLYSLEPIDNMSPPAARNNLTDEGFVPTNSFSQ